MGIARNSSIYYSSAIQLTHAQIALFSEDQPRLNFEPMRDLLHDYRGLLASFPDIFTVQKVFLFFVNLKKNMKFIFFHKRSCKNDENLNVF